MGPARFPAEEEGRAAPGRPSPRAGTPAPTRPVVPAGSDEEGRVSAAEAPRGSASARDALVLTPDRRVPGRRPGAAPPLMLRAPLVRPRPMPDEAALRALVAEAVRAELDGAVRELVQREVRRLLAERDRERDAPAEP